MKTYNKKRNKKENSQSMGDALGVMLSERFETKNKVGTKIQITTIYT